MEENTNHPSSFRPLSTTTDKCPPIFTDWKPRRRCAGIQRPLGGGLGTALWGELPPPSHNMGPHEKRPSPDTPPPGALTSDLPASRTARHTGLRCCYSGPETPTHQRPEFLQACLDSCRDSELIPHCRVKSGKFSAATTALPSPSCLQETWHP